MNQIYKSASCFIQQLYTDLPLEQKRDELRAQTNRD